MDRGNLDRRAAVAFVVLLPIAVVLAGLDATRAVGLVMLAALMGGALWAWEYRR